MVISSNANLIPYEQRHYPAQPIVADKAVAMTRDSIDHYYRYHKPPSDKMTVARQICDCGNRYDSSQCLHYADDYQIGHLVDIYA